MRRHYNIALAAMMLFTASAGYGKTIQVPTEVNKSQTEAFIATPVYEVQILEAGDRPLIFNEPRDLTHRGLGSDLWKALRTSVGNTAIGQIVTSSADLLSSAVGALVEGLRSKKTDWYKQALADCKFVKQLPMPAQAYDFYRSTSTQGALDPNQMVFDGFRCVQYYNTKNSQGEEERIPAFDIVCKLRKDETGLNRILHHGKFEVVIDKFYFNPKVCNLPNDSLDASQINLRVPFDLQRRKNLKITLDTRVKSSWMTEGLNLNADQELGAFKITLVIPDSTALQQTGPYKGWYVYDPQNENVTASKAVPTIVGESFIVPRSFIGTEDGNVFKRVWGTGEYKLDMTLTEECEVNLDFYYDLKHPERRGEARQLAMATGAAEASQRPAGGRGVKFGPDKHHKWNRHWTEEWNKMKQRRKSKGFWRDLADRITVNYKDGRWIYIFTEPVTNTLLDYETRKVSKAINSALGLEGTPVATKPATQEYQGGQSNQGNQGGQSDGKVQ